MRGGNGRLRESITDLPTDAGINTLSVDLNNTLWLGAADGVHLYTQRRWEQWTSELGLADNAVHAITFSPDGAVWFATEGGLSRYQP